MTLFRSGLRPVALAIALTLSLPALPASSKASSIKKPLALRDHAAAAAVDNDDVVLRPAQVVYQVLLAEIALQRGNLELASRAYTDLATRSRDPKTLERAVEVAGFARRYDQAQESLRVWLDVEPESKRAQEMMISVMILSDRLDELAPNLLRLLGLNKATLPNNLLGLNRMFSRNPDRTAVFRLIDKVCNPFFGLAEAHYAVAVAASSASNRERALAEIRYALELRPDWEMAAFLQAQILAQTSSAEAIAFLQVFVERNPTAREARLQLARALIGDKRYAEAKENFEQLLRDFPDRPEVIYPVAILALQQNDRALAETQFKHLLTLEGADKSLAYYYLGQIAEDGKRDEEAIAYYAQIDEGERYLPAQLRIAHVIAAQGRLDDALTALRAVAVRSPEEEVQRAVGESALLREANRFEAAFALLDQLLAEQPDQPDLLYETALLAERLDRVDLLETRLRRLIELRPSSAQALNALGYSFADRNQRLHEARDLIERALKISPDDNFILDSMGWVLYRLGDFPGALTYLERSYAQRDDPEVAAHLGEVMWAMGRRDDAKRVVSEAQKKHPDNASLKAAAKKFAP